MNYHRRTRLAPLAVLSLVTLVSLATLKTTDGEDEPQITLRSMKGRWAMSLVGFTGCGQTSMYVTFTLDARGSAMATIQGHNQCGDQISTWPFVIHSLNRDGSGTAGLTCGTACGWTLIIQVAMHGQMFSVVDVAPVDPGNFLLGTAVRQTPDDQ